MSELDRTELETDLKELIMHELKENNGQGAVPLATKLWQPVSKVIFALEELHLSNKVTKNYNNNKWYMGEQ